MTAPPDSNDVLEAIRDVAKRLGRTPSRDEFWELSTAVTPYHITQYFQNWRGALRAAGLEGRSSNTPLDPSDLLTDWGKVVRDLRRIPTRDQYRASGRFSPGVFEKRFGPWSGVPARFREFAGSRPEWTDVVTLLPPVSVSSTARSNSPEIAASCHAAQPMQPHTRHPKLAGRPTYGDPIDFRGLRHAPVNEQGVVFLFGIVARELGYSIEAVQAGFPDCEGKRRVDVDRWQRVRIEFESKNFRDHGHDPDGCDVVVCWRHNWADCPSTLEVIELRTVIGSLGSAEE